MKAVEIKKNESVYFFYDTQWDIVSAIFPDISYMLPNQVIGHNGRHLVAFHLKYPHLKGIEVAKFEYTPILNKLISDGYTDLKILNKENEAYIDIIRNYTNCKL